MADRVLRGSRLGAVSYETDRNHDLAPRQIARYRTDNGEEFEVPFADDAEIPGTWLCRNGMEGTLIEGDLPEPKKVKPPRTHWDMLLERRSIEELEELLKERLELIRSRRAADPGTPCSRPGNVRSCACVVRARKASLDAPAGDFDQRLTNVGPAHLGHTELALGKGNRHLGDDEPVAHRAPGEIDLEAVALGVHAVQVNRFECFAAVRAVASGDVVDPDSERQARIGVSGFGQD